MRIREPRFDPGAGHFLKAHVGKLHGIHLLIVDLADDAFIFLPLFSGNMLWFLSARFHECFPSSWGSPLCAGWRAPRFSEAGA